MLLSNRRIKIIIALVTFIITTSIIFIHTCDDKEKQVIKKREVMLTEVEHVPITYFSSSLIVSNNNLTKERKVISSNSIEAPEELVRLASNKKPYVYYEVYDFFYGSDKYHSLDYELQEYTYELCIEYDIEEYYTLILCQLYYESKYNAKAISSSGDYGIAQINKCNHKWLSRKLGITDFLDAEQSISCNIYMMSDFLKKYNVESSLFCYNTGSPNGSNTYSDNIIYMWNNGVREIKE